MIRIDIKPLSVNEAWEGRRFKTKEYKLYEKLVLWKLPKFKLPEPPFQIEITYGFSNNASDIDNPTKLIFDILQKKYKFNDNQIYRMLVEKGITKKGQEYIQFEITHYTK